MDARPGHDHVRAGGDYGSANAISNNGQVAGTSWVTGTEQHAFLWTAKDGTRDLGTLNGTLTNAADVNDAGQVMGTGYDQDTGLTRSFVWTKQTGMVDIGTLGGSQAVAYTENASGQVVGTSTLPGDAEWQAFIWTRKDGMKQLPSLGGPNTDAVYINDHGDIAGDGQTADFQFHPFIWTRAGGIVDLGTLGGPNAYAFPTGLSPDGEVIGYSSTEPDFAEHAWSLDETEWNG